MIAQQLTRTVAFLLALFSSCAIAGAPLAQRELPGDSVYQLDAHLVDQGGKPFQLRSLQGSPLLVAMFYASCKYTCPLIIEEIKRTVQALDAPGRKKVRVLLVSFDPARDTPAALKSVGEEHHVDLARWTLASTAPAEVRKIAAVLGVQYRQLTNGDFSHSTMITLLDKEGRIIARSSETGKPDPELVAAANRTLAGQNPQGTAD